MIFLEETRDNLYGFYEEIAKSAGIAYSVSGNLRIVHNVRKTWPNYILGGEIMDPSDLEILSRQTDEGILPSFWVNLRNPAAEEMLSLMGWRLIRQWTGMYFDQQVPERQFCFPLEITTQEISTEDHHGMWLEIVNNSLMSTRKISREIITALSGNSRFRFFLSFLNNEPAASLLVFSRNSVSGLYMIAVREELRGKGLGTSITSHAVQKLMGEGVATIVLHATEMGLPIYSRLGFKKNGLFDIYWKTEKTR
jgi:ribosomal protein S18 acetylase RimI-like enzyme